MSINKVNLLLADDGGSCSLTDRHDKIQQGCDWRPEITEYLEYCQYDSRMASLRYWNDKMKALNG